AAMPPAPLYPLSLHDALPISQLQQAGIVVLERDPYLAGVTEYDAYAARIAHAGADAIVFAGGGSDAADMVRALRRFGVQPTVLRSEEHTSELQSQSNLVCRLL